MHDALVLFHGASSDPLLCADRSPVCVFDVDRKNKKMTLVELAPGVTEAEVREKTGAKFDVAKDLKLMTDE